MSEKPTENELSTGPDNVRAASPRYVDKPLRSNDLTSEEHIEGWFLNEKRGMVPFTESELRDFARQLALTRQDETSRFLWANAWRIPWKYPPQDEVLLSVMLHIGTLSIIQPESENIEWDRLQGISAHINNLEIDMPNVVRDLIIQAIIASINGNRKEIFHLAPIPEYVWINRLHINKSLTETDENPAEKTANKGDEKQRRFLGLLRDTFKGGR